MNTTRKSGGQTFLSVRSAASCQDYRTDRNVCPPDSFFISYLNCESLHRDQNRLPLRPCELRIRSWKSACTIFRRGRPCCRCRLSKRPTRTCWPCRAPASRSWEISHRSKAFEKIINQAEANIRTLLGVPNNYRVLFLQGGALLQFAMVPMKPPGRHGQVGRLRRQRDLEQEGP